MKTIEQWNAKCDSLTTRLARAEAERDEAVDRAVAAEQARSHSQRLAQLDREALDEALTAVQNLLDQLPTVAFQSEGGRNCEACWGDLTTPPRTIIGLIGHSERCAVNKAKELLARLQPAAGPPDKA